MNARTETLAPRAAWTARLADYVELTKPRITTLVLVTTWVGFFVADPRFPDVLLMLHLLMGTALVCSGSSALNQAWEHAYDRRMRRTEARPVPSGRVGRGEALAFGSGIALLGTLQLLWFVGPLPAALAAGTLLLYLLAYTPLKRHSWISTTVGAVPGAVPPLIGWAAAQGTLGPGAWALFAIQFVWQLPHFYAIGWMYRDDYARGGFKILPVIDGNGDLTVNQIVSWCAVLLPASLLPVLDASAGLFYAAAAIPLGLLFLASGLRLLRRRTRAQARQVFFVSIVYLPVLLGALVIDNLLRS